MVRALLQEPDAPAARAPRAPPAVAPPAPAPAPEASAAPLPAAPPAEPPDDRRVEIRARLERDLAAHFPELKLSSDEIDAAADALVRLREARLELALLPRTPEHGERRRELLREIGRAYEDFEYVVELDPAEFTERVGGEESE